MKKVVEAIRNIAPPKTRKQLRSFIGMVNYYRDMWPQRSHLLSPLTNLTLKMLHLNGQMNIKKHLMKSKQS